MNEGPRKQELYLEGAPDEMVTIRIMIGVTTKPDAIAVQVTQSIYSQKAPDQAQVGSNGDSI